MRKLFSAEAIKLVLKFAGPKSIFCGLWCGSMVSLRHMQIFVDDEWRNIFISLITPGADPGFDREGSDRDRLKLPTVRSSIV